MILFLCIFWNTFRYIKYMSEWIDFEFVLRLFRNLIVAQNTESIQLCSFRSSRKLFHPKVKCLSLKLFQIIKWTNRWSVSWSEYLQIWLLRQFVKRNGNKFRIYSVFKYILRRFVQWPCPMPMYSIGNTFQLKNNHFAISFIGSSNSGRVCHCYHFQEYSLLSYFVQNWWTNVPDISLALSALCTDETIRGFLIPWSKHKTGLWFGFICFAWIVRTTRNHSWWVASVWLGGQPSSWIIRAIKVLKRLCQRW